METLFNGNLTIFSTIFIYHIYTYSIYLELYLYCDRQVSKLSVKCHIIKGVAHLFCK